MKSTEEKIEVMQAFMRGETIEAQIRNRDTWKPCIAPVWDWYNIDYRVKPKTTTFYWAVLRNPKNNTLFFSSMCYDLSRYKKLKKDYENEGYVVIREYIDEFSH